MARRRRRSYDWGGELRSYVPVARRRWEAARFGASARQHGEVFDPIRIAGRAIATSAWGRAWCQHIEGFHDFVNRLPRGRTYARNGSVIHLEVRTGEIRAKVMGSSLYEQHVAIEPCKDAVWKRLRRRCAGGIGSLIELLEGRLSSEVMAAMTGERDGLLPDLGQVRMSCSCPDWASLCKHLAAVLYGVGARLDERPELLFTLRGVSPAELVDAAALPARIGGAKLDAGAVGGDLASIFGIELDDDPEPAAARSARPKPPKKPPKKAARPARAPAKRTVRRGELLEAGVPAGTISTWLRQGVLLSGAERGVYRHTAESRARLVSYVG